MKVIELVGSLQPHDECMKFSTKNFTQAFQSIVKIYEKYSSLPSQQNTTEGQPSTNYIRGRGRGRGWGIGRAYSRGRGINFSNCIDIKCGWCQCLGHYEFECRKNKSD